MSSLPQFHTTSAAPEQAEHDLSSLTAADRAQRALNNWRYGPFRAYFPDNQKVESLYGRGRADKSANKKPIEDLVTGLAIVQIPYPSRFNEDPESGDKWQVLKLLDTAFLLRKGCANRRGFYWKNTADRIGLYSATDLNSRELDDWHFKHDKPGHEIHLRNIELLDFQRAAPAEQERWYRHFKCALCQAPVETGARATIKRAKKYPFCEKCIEEILDTVFEPAREVTLEEERLIVESMCRELK